MATYIIVAILAYAIGSVNFFFFLSRKMVGFDVREKGSGNAGTTNVLRAVGIKAAIITLICDILKGVVAVLLAFLIGNMSQTADRALLVQIAGLLVVVGHTFPIFFEFRGGKGIATALGVLFVTNWKIALICLVFAIVLIAITRMVSVGSMSAAVLFPILTLFIGDNFIVAQVGIKYFIYSLLLAAFVIFNHRENIKRIMNGTENKISFKK